MREVRDQAVPAFELPQVDDFGPPSGRPDRAPHAEAQHVALGARRRAPVRRHVVHVTGAVVPDDLDELVDVDLAVHPRNLGTTASPNSRIRAGGTWKASHVTPRRASACASSTSASGSTASLWAGWLKGVKQMSNG